MLVHRFSRLLVIQLETLAAVINFYHQKLPPVMITKELMMKVFLPNALDEIALLI